MGSSIGGSTGTAPRHTLVTWDEYLRLQRDSEILDWVEADYARHVAPKGGAGLRQMVGDLIDAGCDLSQSLADACRELATRRGKTAAAAGPPSRR